MKNIQSIAEEPCSFTKWMESWNPFISDIPGLETPLDLLQEGMYLNDHLDSLMCCYRCKDCIIPGKLHPGMDVYNILDNGIDLPAGFWPVISRADESSDLLTAIKMGLFASRWCEDNGHISASIDFRMNVVESIQKYHRENDNLCPVPGVDEVLLADLLRRSCRFDMVCNVVNLGLSLSEDKIVENALEFQNEKVKTWDTLRYTYGFQQIEFRSVKNPGNSESTEVIR